MGNGSNIRIWQDPWVPHGTTRRPSTNQGDCTLERVSELIDEVTCSWNQDLITQIFHSDDVPLILSIPLRDEVDDFIAWHFDNKGLFSVKSAYKVHCDMLKRESTAQTGQGSASMSVRTEVFTILWNVQRHQRYTISYGS